MSFQKVWERFHSGYTVVDECWLWNQCLNRGGYGQIKVAGKMVYVHRLSLNLHGIDIPEGYDACHNCPNKARHCVNPEHLYAGTRAQNMADKILDGTSKQGEKHHHSKLTEAQVLEIRSRSTENQCKLAKEFGVCQERISSIILRKSWTHI